MRIAIILALASLGAIIAGALHVRAARGRDKRTTLSEQQKNLAESDAQPTAQPEHSAQTEAPKPVEFDTGLIQSDEPKANAVASGSLITESVNPHEQESRVEVASPQEGEHSLTRDSTVAEVSATGFSEIPDTSASVTVPAQSGVDEDLHGTDDQLANQRGPLSPDKSGGRPRATAQTSEPREGVTTPRRTVKLEIVCWNREREWILAVETPEELQEPREISVSQNSVELAEDDVENGCWRLAELRGEIVVRALESGDVREIKSILGDDDHLLFKLSGAHLNQGHCVKQPSSGSYLVIVPENWERSEDLGGTAPATPEPVCFEGFRAHFFDLLGNSATNIAFRDRTGRSIVIGSNGPHFELVGQKVPDASENLGPLFGGQTPSINILAGSWDEVGIIVLGEEGSGTGRWRTSLKPNLDLPTQQVPDNIASRGAGWYFVRFYNLEDELIDSLDFRFAAGLRAITIQRGDVSPSTTGHQVTTVEFQHDADWYVARSCASPGEVNVERTDEKTILTIPPMQDSDRTQWLLGLPGGPRVEVSILVERIWWAISEENILPGQWTDKQLAVTRDDLQATSNKALWLRLPKPRWSHSVLVGFNQVSARPYPVLVTESAVAVPLRDFGDVPETGTIGEHSLRIWVSHQETTYETSVCKLAVRAGCTFDDFTATTEEEVLQHVRAHHLPEFIRVLTWEEHRQRMPDLPTVIYRCGYDSFYVAADNAPHPDGAIIRHIQDVHAAAVGHPVQIRFSIVHDTEEIRQNVIASLPRIHRCKLCASEFENFDEADLWRHLVEMHKSRLLDLR